MAVIETKLWGGEPIKAVLHLGKSEYVVYTDTTIDNSGNFIKQANFELSEGNDRVNPLGVSSSNSVSLQIYDANDYLSPVNEQSPYFGLTVNGVEIELFITYNGVNWEPYGTYYATSWSGGYSDGGHGLVSINAEDKLNTIGNMEMPEIEAYANVKVSQLIADVMAGLNIPASGYSIDSSLNTNVYFGVAAGNKVRDFWNNICQLILARVIIDRKGVICFIPALGIYSNSNEIMLAGDETGSFTNKNNSNINYNKISVKYLEAGDTSREQLFSDSSRVLVNGNNKINDISFKFRALSIEQVKVLFKNNDKSPRISSMQYTGYQNGIRLQINVENGPINECVISGEGVAVSTTTRSVSAAIANTSIIGGSTFEFDTKQMMTRSSANALLKDLQTYISKIGRTVVMSGTALTPKLYTGDRITISGTDTMYDGWYKISGLSISFGEDYSMSVTMLRL